MSFNTEVQPGIRIEPDAVAQEYVFNHTILRVKDLKRSFDFYSQVFGMRLLRRPDFGEGRFSLYFLAMIRDEEVPNTADERQQYIFGRQPIPELAHSRDSESNDSQCHSGNQDPRGFGHICFPMPDLVVACERFETSGADFVKSLDRGMKNVTFISDPGDYRVEIVRANLSGEVGRG